MLRHRHSIFVLFGFLITILCHQHNSVLCFITSSNNSSSWANRILHNLETTFQNVFQNDDCIRPPNFPSTIEISQTDYNNWANILTVKNLWTAVPKTQEDIITLSNWAKHNGYTIRPNGYMNNFSPLTVTVTTDCNKVLLVNTVKFLKRINIVNPKNESGNNLFSVQVETGATVEEILNFLESYDFSIPTSPPAGEMTIGGVTAINCHGRGISISRYHYKQTTLPAGFTFGTFSNYILSLTAVVSDGIDKPYKLKTFLRSDIHSGAFLTHLGRAFLTELTLRVIPNYNMRCISKTDIPTKELFAAPSITSNKLRTFANLIEMYGDLRVLWFPFTADPWVNICTNSPTKPIESREVKTPYNYPFTDGIPRRIALIMSKIFSGAGFLTPLLSTLQSSAMAAGLDITKSRDIWGRSKNLLLSVRLSSLPLTEMAYAVLTSRSNIQLVISSIVNRYQKMTQEYANQGKYPMNGINEIRMTGLDNPNDIQWPEATSPALSVARIQKNHPEYDVIIWMDFLTNPKTPHYFSFFHELESYLLDTFDGGIALALPEWSKGWAYTESGAWSNNTLLKNKIPILYGRGLEINDWDWAITTLNSYDPSRIFTNDFLDSFLLPSSSSLSS